jgi:MraZ protein
VFKGSFRHRIDPKGRLPVPAVFRRALERAGEASLVLTPLDQCLAVYPGSEWDKLEAQLRALPAFSKPVKALTRLLASRAADCNLDVQGRILLPPPLREAAGLGREALLIGVLNRFEIWSPEAWDGFVRESERFLDDVTLDLQWPLPPQPPSEPPSAPPLPQAKPRR